MLQIIDLHARIEGNEILHGINLAVNPGEVHAIMGPNGSGKSTLAKVLAGRAGYEVTGGKVLYDGKHLLGMAPEDRTREGIFLGFQYPVEIPGVNNVYVLRAALNARRKHHGEPETDAVQFMKLVREKAKLMQIGEQFLNRGINEGFSGGEKKRNEILQLGILDPRLAILDETDSGPDIDALKIVAQGINLTDLILAHALVTRQTGDKITFFLHLVRLGAVQLRATITPIKPTDTELRMAVRVVYSTDPDPLEQCPRCGRVPCVCNKIDLAPRQQTAYVQRDRKRRAGKTVTVISGLQHTPVTFKDLLKALQTACGTGGTVKEGELELQGDHRECVAEKVKELGYKVKFVGG